MQRGRCAGYAVRTRNTRHNLLTIKGNSLIEQRLGSLFALVLALGCGALLPFTLAPFDWWPLGIGSIGGWFWLLNRRPGSAAALGFAFGVGKFGVGVSWVYVSMRLYGGASVSLAVFLVALFVAGLSVFTLLQGWVYARVASRGAAMLDAALFAAVWVIFEWLLTWFLTGFPWLYPGYGHLQTVLANLMPIGGVSLASLGIVVTSVYLAVALTNARRVTALVLATVPWAIGLALSPIEWVQSGAPRTVALVQGNVDQTLKWDADNRLSIVDTYLDLTDPHWGTDLVVWPEAAITLYEHQAREVLEFLDERGEESGTTVVLGIATAQRTPDGTWMIYNSALATGPGAGRYTKRQLVPFGDYVPFEDLLRGLIGFFDLPMSAFTAGPWHQGPLHTGTARAAMAICYEIAYAELMRQSAAGADVLITVSNDTWFGTSIGPLQHAQIARARALENGRWLLRGTNNGVTAIVDHRGRMTDALPQFEQAVLSGEFHIMKGRTPYSRYGDGWLVALCLAGLIAGLFHRDRAASRTQGGAVK